MYLLNGSSPDEIEETAFAELGRDGKQYTEISSGADLFFLYLYIYGRN